MFFKIIRFYPFTFINIRHFITYSSLSARDGFLIQIAENSLHHFYKPVFLFAERFQINNTNDEEHWVKKLKRRCVEMIQIYFFTL